MRKKICIVVALCCMVYISHAQNKAKLPVDEVSKLITYTSVSELPGISKDSLYRKALAWCHEYFVNPVEVIREQDPKAGKIVCKGRFKVMDPADKKGIAAEGGNVQYTLN